MKTHFMLQKALPCQISFWCFWWHISQIALAPFTNSYCCQQVQCRHWFASELLRKLDLKSCGIMLPLVTYMLLMKVLGALDIVSMSAESLHSTLITNHNSDHTVSIKSWTTLGATFPLEQSNVKTSWQHQTGLRHHSAQWSPNITLNAQGEKLTSV